MHRCDITGISCESREVLTVPGNPPLWVAPSVKLLFLLGKNVPQIKQLLDQFNDKLGTLSGEERIEFFKGSNVEIR